MMIRVRKRISIVLVDDNPHAREGVVRLIRAEPGFRVLTTSATIGAVTRTVRETRPALVLLNLTRKGNERLTLADALHVAAPEVPVVMLGLGRRQEDVASLVRAGVAGFIMANATFALYLSTIHLVAAGIRVLPPDLTHALFSQLNHDSIRRRRRWTRPSKEAASRPHAGNRLEVGVLSTPVVLPAPAFNSPN